MNAYIEDARIKLHQTFNELEEQGQFITARLLQEKFFGQDQVPEVVRTLIQTIQEHNDQCRELVGKDYALITVRRYESCKRYLAELIKLKYGKEDLPLSEVNGEPVRAFEFYLKTEKECQQNTVIRYMKCLKKITNLALANEWISKDPLIGIKFHEKEVIREFLTMDELLTIYHKEFPLERITIVRDVFIFAAFTNVALNRMWLQIRKLPSGKKKIGNGLETIEIHHFAYVQCVNQLYKNTNKLDISSIHMN